MEVKTWALPVNTVQGFLLDDKDSIIGAYSHKEQKLYFLPASSRRSCIIPANLTDYRTIKMESVNFFEIAHI